MLVKIMTGRALVQAFEKASGKKVNHKIVPRRGGDSTAVYAATETAEKELGWKSKLDVNDMCRDQWAWASVSSDDSARCHAHLCSEIHWNTNLFLSSGKDLWRSIGKDFVINSCLPQSKYESQDADCTFCKKMLP